mmetsp:Transcript_71840/g.160853  ORF Transcript_71840/g.160853 Transcript_71840/m.160853 type:complete len:224 (-) Transcript_71840:310-981(-)
MLVITWMAMLASGLASDWRRLPAVAHALDFWSATWLCMEASCWPFCVTSPCACWHFWMSALTLALRSSRVSFFTGAPPLPEPVATFSLPPPPGTTMLPSKLSAVKSGMSMLKDPPCMAPTLISGTWMFTSGMVMVAANCTAMQSPTAAENFAEAAARAEASAGQKFACATLDPICCFVSSSVFFFWQPSASCCVLLRAFCCASTSPLLSLTLATHWPSSFCRS